jgi:hypothetical protein
VPAPTADEIRKMMDRHCELWNAGDKEAWLNEWQTFLPGGVAMEDPVGTPVKRGWEMMSEVWDASPNADWKLSVERLTVCGNEAAAIIRNAGTVNGAPLVIESIEIYQFGDDRSCYTKTFWEIGEDNAYAEWSAKTGE